MQLAVEHNEVEDTLRRSGVTWNAAQSHGLLCGRLAVRGREAGREWISELAGSAGQEARLSSDSVDVLDVLFKGTYGQLAERQSQFALLLPEDSSPASVRAEALAHWCEGYLHGLVSGSRPEAVKKQLASEPLSEVIKDFLQITRAAADDEVRDESDEQAYAELVEYVRVGAQLAYEELAAIRTRSDE